MPALSYTKPTILSLKRHPDFTEVWLQDRIQDDPSILGLGDVAVLDRERRQDKAGRLDLLLSDPDLNRRYEVEIMLGQTDESHIIRTIEYWDIERRRYPSYDHCAVLIAEDVTARFLNILSLLAGTVPLIVIQLNALQVGDQIVLDFVRVLDQTSLRRDDEGESSLVTTDRSYWVNRSTQEMVKLTERLLEIINEKASSAQQLNFNRHYVGLSDGIRSRNFVHFRPRKQFVHVLAEVPDIPAWVEKIEEGGLPAATDRGRLRFTIAPKDLKSHGDLVRDAIHAAVEHYES